MQQLSRLLALAAGLAALSACATTRPRVPVHGKVAGVTIKTTADSKIATYYVESYLAGINDEPELHARIDELHREYADRMPTSAELAAIGRELSNDFGSLFLAQLIHLREQNRRLQEKFNHELARLKELQKPSVDSKPLEVLFVPAWLHRDNLKSGANLMTPRNALKAAGLRCHVVRVLQDATVEENAQILADTILRLRDSGKEYMIVSVSKSGAEAAMALGELVPPEQSRHVRAWINISGALRGTPLVESILSSPEGKFLLPLFWLNGWDTASLDTLAPEIRRESFERANIPEELIVINMVGIPLSGQYSEQGNEGYDYLNPYGPNDGVTLTADTMVPGRPTLLQLGLDHYYESPDLPMWAVAIYGIVAGQLETVVASGGEPNEAGAKEADSGALR